MSQEDVEIVRRSWAAWERGDTEAIFAMYDEEVVWDFSRAWRHDVATPAQRFSISSIR